MLHYTAWPPATSFKPNMRTLAAGVGGGGGEEELLPSPSIDNINYGSLLKQSEREKVAAMQQTGGGRERKSEKKRAREKKEEQDTMIVDITIGLFLPLPRERTVGSSATNGLPLELPPLPLLLSATFVAVATTVCSFCRSRCCRSQHCHDYLKLILSRDCYQLLTTTFSPLLLPLSTISFHC
ncbi:hypothetical protein GW17_00017356 [Ensete ventricosum]|nr:hypothetical protein GW17_00017356 [Ensete ventricosum]